MSLRDLVPWRRREGRQLARQGEESPLQALQQEMNRLFDEFFHDVELAPFEGEGGLGSISPTVDVRETDKQIRISAELPGMDEKDIDVSLSENALTLRGEKQSEQKSDDERYHRIERSYGAFHRVVPLPAEVDPDKVDATFKNGVLNIVLPKVVASASAKKIDVRRAE